MNIDATVKEADWPKRTDDKKNFTIKLPTANKPAVKSKPEQTKK